MSRCAAAASHGESSQSLRLKNHPVAAGIFSLVQGLVGKAHGQFLVLIANIGHGHTTAQGDVPHPRHSGRSHSLTNFLGDQKCMFAEDTVTAPAPRPY